MKVLVVGASGGSGQAVVERLLAEGHAVTAFSRTPSSVEEHAARFRHVRGDATVRADVDRAVRDHDAVVVTLGIRENLVKVRVLGSGRTPIDVRSVGTAHVIDAMRAHGVRRLVVLSAYGVGDTRERLRWRDRILLDLFLKPQIDDSERQEELVRTSGLEWVIARPVYLTDGVDDPSPFVTTDGSVRQPRVTRRSVGRFLAEAAANDDFVGRAVSLSGIRT